ncbi:ATPase, T2SS/T4P/T4SS family [Viridibacillus sp. NPDC093762]|uniref:ATPase, T2SS/T4P/T4SS family n=1 Tax=Viridibacillus sp. NPDC093762 TaxID=3390720 RepID=UPI003CFCFC75
MINQHQMTEEEQIERLLLDSFLGDYLDEKSTITDITFNGTDLWLKDNKEGHYRPTSQPSEEEVKNLGKKIANKQGRQFNPGNPILDTEIGVFRVNFIDTSISPSGTTCAIRISRPRLAMDSISAIADEDVEKLMSVLIKAGQNFVISGKTGAGKTELQKLMAKYINNKVTLIEDTMDSHMKALYPDTDINSWRTLTESTREHKIDAAALNKAALRNNPDWIIIAETRDHVMYHLLQSAMTDHSIITTLHSKGAKMIPSRIIFMIAEKYQINELLLGRAIVEALPFGVYMWVEEDENGQVVRFMREFVEFTGFSEQGLEYNTLYEVKKTYNSAEDKYEKYVVRNKLSDRVLDDLMYRGFYHELPDVYKYGEKKSEGIEK